MRKLYDNALKLTEKYYWLFFFILSLAIAFLCFRCLGIKYVDSWDEARHGISAYEMIQNKNFLVNTYLGEPDYWNVKPPLSFLTVAAGFLIFGYNTIGLRFFSALSYLLASVCTGLFAKRYGKLASLFTLLFLAANYFPFKAHLVRAGDADSLYLLLFTLSMLAMLYIPKKQYALYLCALFFALAFLTKSFHAGMIAAIGGLFLLLTGEIKKMKPGTWLRFLFCALLPILLWAVLRYTYDGTVFFRNMYEADLAGRTAAGGLEGHGFPFSFYWTSIFWNFDYIYGWLTVGALLLACWSYFRPLSGLWKDFPLADRIGLSLWILLPFFGFSAVSTKLMWYVYPCTVPLCLLSGIFLQKFLTNKKLPAILAMLFGIAALAGSGKFIWNNYLDNVRGAHGNDLQTFISENFSRGCALTGMTVYLDAYDPFLYANTDTWEQNNRLLAMLEGDMTCRDGGAKQFLADDKDCLLILSIPFLENYPELQNLPILADNGQYLLLGK